MHVVAPSLHTGRVPLKRAICAPIYRHSHSVRVERDTHREKLRCVSNSYTLCIEGCGIINQSVYELKPHHIMLHLLFMQGSEHMCYYTHVYIVAPRGFGRDTCGRE